MDRELHVYWDTVSENGCLAEYHDLFKGENVKLITLEEVENLRDCIIFSEGNPVVADNDANNHGAERESVTYGRHALKKLGETYGLKYFNDFDYAYETENKRNIIIYHNNFLPRLDLNDSIKFLQNLEPTEFIQSIIDEQTKKLQLDDTTIGVHARGTDFNTDHGSLGSGPYIKNIQTWIDQYPHSNFLLCTEDKLFENEIKEEFGSKIKTFDKNFIYERKDENKVDARGCPWTNNFVVSKDHAVEAVIDMFLLSKTNIRIFNPASTFSQVARVIGKQV